MIIIGHVFFFLCHFLSTNCVCSPRASDLFPRLLATPPPFQTLQWHLHILPTPRAHTCRPPTPRSPSLTLCTWPNPPRWAATTRLFSHLHLRDRQPTHCGAISAEHTQKKTRLWKTITMMLTAHLLLHTEGVGRGGGGGLCPSFVHWKAWCQYYICANTIFACMYVWRRCCDCRLARRCGEGGHEFRVEREDNAENRVRLKRVAGCGPC